MFRSPSTSPESRTSPESTSETRVAHCVRVMITFELIRFLGRFHFHGNATQNSEVMITFGLIRFLGRFYFHGNATQNISESDRTYLIAGEGPLTNECNLQTRSRRHDQILYRLVLKLSFSGSYVKCTMLLT
ncbi:hypothetical protein HanRHA438_Chr14g0670911 [Helianthus annuus]|nr:hypothetical protein HanRHA438_Chr14g0670911 [Helianthus annuus]